MSNNNSRRNDSRDEAEMQMRQMSRRGFLWGGAAMASAWAFDRWLNTRRQEDGIGWPFRQMFAFNEQLADDYYNPHRLAPTFPLSSRTEPYLNGEEGMRAENMPFDPLKWTLRLEGAAQSGSAVPVPPSAGVDLKRTQSGGTLPDKTETAATPYISLTMADIHKIAHEKGFTEMVTEFKCIEGWSKIVHWGGIRFSDFIAAYPPATISGDPPDVMRKPEDLPPYVGLVTPDGGYYVGIEMTTALHLQTLLCYEMSGRPLAIEHGAPLRLVTTLKYGIKQIKRIGTIRYSRHRPPDFWAEQGYDFYSGH